MDPIIALLIGAVFPGIPLGIAVDRAVIPWVAHYWALRLRTHVRIR